MVSVSGYAISEYVFAMGLTYFLLLMAYVVSRITKELDEEEGVAKAMSSHRLRVVVSLGFAAVVAVVYSLQVRMGTVMFINGVIVGLLFGGCVKIVRRWNPFGGMKDAVESVGKALAK